MLIYLNLILILSLCVGSLNSELIWDLENEAVVIQASAENLQSLSYSTENKNSSGENQRVKRQFTQFGGSQFGHFPQFQGFQGFQGFPQFPPGWPFITQQQQQIPGFPSVPSVPATPPPVATTPTTTTTTTAPGSCRTRNGLEGRCGTLRSCYSVVFSSIEGEEEKLRNPGLAADITERAGPCDVDISSQMLFRADAAEIRNSICCASDSPSYPTTQPKQPHSPVNNLFHPQITMRPPWASWSTKATTTTPTTTTTTTMRPPTAAQTQRSTIFPNWPPAFITHPPSHFPSWVFTTGGVGVVQQPTTTSATTARPPPHHQWPPAATTGAPLPPASSSCGYTKIVGGSQATKGEFPWLVAIMRHGRQICGGSLIDSQWILSAAHCFPNFQSHDVAGLRVQIGDYDIYSHQDGPATIKSVTKLVRHSGFNMQILHNDIALLKLDSPVQFGSNGNNNIQPICLARSAGYEGTTVTVAGWGGIYEGGPQPAIYKKVDLTVWNNQQCAAKYGHRAPGGITSQMVCAGSPNADACRGDSGGPLMRNTGGRWEQIGVVSWGIGCGSYPVYTRVEHYSDWIAKNRRN